MADELDRLQQKQEAKASEDLSQLLTEAVQADAVREDAAGLVPKSEDDADPLTRAGWPKEATSAIRTVYQRAMTSELGRNRGSYRNYDIETELRVRQGRPPEVRATAVYKIRRVGGVTHVIKAGETIRSIARWHYGLVCYSNRVWEENRRSFGPSCRQLPAGFPVVLPPADVPWWDRAPRIKAAPGTTSKAVRILNPALDVAAGNTYARKVSFGTEEFSIEIICRFRGDAYIQKKGTLEPGFSLKSYRSSATKALADLMGANFVLTAEEKRGTLLLSVTNRKARGLRFTGQTRLSTGGPKVRLSGSMEDVLHKDHMIRFMMSIEAALRIVPRKTGKAVTKFETALAVSAAPSGGGFAPRPILPAKGSSEPAADRGAAAVLSKLGVG